MVPAVPLHLPVRAMEAAALAEIVFQCAEGRPLREDVRNRIASRAAGEHYESFRPFIGSLAQDPVHDDAYFVAVDALADERAVPLLLRIALASAPASGVFPNATLIARTRSGNDREFVINAIPFSPSDHKEIGVYVEQVDRGFLPRPQGGQAAIAVAADRPEIVLGAAFQAYRQIAKSSGQNLAAVVCAGCDPERFLDAALWSAIRAGWRDGFSAGIRVTMAEGIEAARKLAYAGRNYTKFTVVVSSGGDELEACAQLYASIAEAKANHRPWKHFDFELSLAGSGVTSPEDVAYCLEWMKRRGCLVHSIVPDLAGLNGPDQDLRLADLAKALRPFNAGITVQQPLPRPKQMPAGSRLSYELAVRATEAPERVVEFILETAALR